MGLNTFSNIIVPMGFYKNFIISIEVKIWYIVIQLFSRLNLNFCKQIWYVHILIYLIAFLIQWYYPVAQFDCLMLKSRRTQIHCQACITRHDRMHISLIPIQI